MLLGPILWAGLAFVGAGWGVAWACIPQPLVSVDPRASGPAGATVNVVGSNFPSGEVEVRWNSVQGELLGKVSSGGSQVSVSIDIPQTGEGLYALIVFIRSPSGGIGSSARAAFEVTAAGPGRGDDLSRSSRTGGGGGIGRTSRSSIALTPWAIVGGAGAFAVAGFAGVVVGTWLRRRRVGTGERM